MNRTLQPFVFLFASITIVNFDSFGQQTAELVSALQHDSIPIQLYTFTPKLMEVDYTRSGRDHRTYKRSSGNSYSYNLGPEQLLTIKSTIPIVKIRKKSAISLSVQYNYYDQPSTVDNLKGAQSSHLSSFQQATFSKVGASFAHRTSIKNIKVVFAGSLSIIGKQFWDINQVNGVFSLAFPLRNTRSTSLTFGINYIYNPSIAFPVIPTIVYATKLSTHWHFETILPSYIKLRYIYNDKTYFASGVKINSDKPQYHINGMSVASQLEMRNAAFCFFLNTEYHLGGLFWMSAEAGYNYMARSRLSQPSGHNNEYLAQAKDEGALYGNVGIFIRPPLKMVLAKMKQKRS